jgi:hypothetical protein
MRSVEVGFRLEFPLLDPQVAREFGVVAYSVTASRSVSSIPHAEAISRMRSPYETCASSPSTARKEELVDSNPAEGCRAPEAPASALAHLGAGGGRAGRQGVFR